MNPYWWRHYSRQVRRVDYAAAVMFLVLLVMSIAGMGGEAIDHGTPQYEEAHKRAWRYVGREPMPKIVICSDCHIGKGKGK